MVKLHASHLTTPRTKEAAMERLLALKKEHEISMQERQDLADQESLTLESEIDDALKGLAVIVLGALATGMAAILLLG